MKFILHNNYCVNCELIKKMSFFTYEINIDFFNEDSESLSGAFYWHISFILDETFPDKVRFFIIEQIFKRICEHLDSQDVFLDLNGYEELLIKQYGKSST